MKRTLALLAALLRAPLVALHAAAAPKTHGRPNIVFFLMDDMGWPEDRA